MGRIRELVSWLVLLILAIAITSCHDPAPPPGSGALILGERTILPSTPNPELNGGQHETLMGLMGIHVVVTRVDVVHRTIASDPSTERVITVDSTTRTLDIAGNLAEGAPRVLGYFNVPAGFVYEIRAVISSATIDLRGQTFDVEVPSGSQTGLKFSPPDGVPLPITDNHRTSVQAQVNPFDQLLRNRGQGFIMHPIVPTVLVTIDQLSPVLQDRIVVRFNDGVTRAQIDAINASNGTRIIDGAPSINYYLLALPASLPIDTALQRFAGMSEVRYTLPDNTLGPDLLPCNPEVAANGAFFSTIDAPTAWDVTRGGRGHSNAVVAVLDYGFDLNSPSLVPNIAINQGELPAVIFDRDRNGGTSTTAPVGDPFVNDGVVDQHDIDRFDVTGADGVPDGVIAFDDLAAFQAMAQYPCAGLPTSLSPTGTCDANSDGTVTPTDLVSGTGHARPAADAALFEDGLDENQLPCAGIAFCDDVVGWDFRTPGNFPGHVVLEHGNAMAAIIGGFALTPPMCSANRFTGVNWAARMILVTMGPSRFATTAADQISQPSRANLEIAMNYAGLVRSADIVSTTWGAMFVRADSNVRNCGGPAEIVGVGDKWPRLMTGLGSEAADMVTSLGRGLFINSAGNCGHAYDTTQTMSFYFPPQANLVDRTGVNRMIAVASASNSTGAASSRISSFSEFAAPPLVSVAGPGEDQDVMESGDVVSRSPEHGTSAAQAYVTGAAALAFAADPTLRAAGPGALRARLLSHRPTRTTVGPTGTPSIPILDLACVVNAPPVAGLCVPGM